MSDDKSDGLDDLDWGNALDEWEKNTFVPEMARDAETNRIALPLGKEAKEGKAHSDGEHADKHETPVPPPPSTKQTMPPVRGSIPSMEPRYSQRPSLRGGLDQLFSRGREPTPVPRPPLRTEPALEEALTLAELPSLGEDPGERDRDGDPDTRALKLDESGSSSSIVVEEFDDVPHEDATVERFVVEEAPVSTSAEQADIYATDLPGTRPFVRSDLPLVDAGDRHPADDEVPTLARASSIPVGHRPSAAPAAAVVEVPIELPESGTTAIAPVSFEGERPASRWLDDARTKTIAGSIAWLEEEAQAQGDPTVRGRALLALSELCALLNDPRAEDFATEARGAAPHLPLAWRQARQLMPQDPETVAHALTTEAAHSPTAAARAHATLLAADLLRRGDRGDDAVEHWERARKLDPTDVRAPIARAAVALAKDDHSDGALLVADNSELAELDRAIVTALRLRGVERPTADISPIPINDGLRHVRTALASGDVVRAAQAAAAIGETPELSKAANWLSSTLGAVHIAGRRGSARSLKSLANEGDPLARRQLAARGMELADPDLVTVALTSGSAFDPAERAVLEALAHPDQPARSDLLEVLVADPSGIPLADALTATHPAKGSEDAVVARSKCVAGEGPARALASVGRLLAFDVSSEALTSALAAVPEPRSTSASGVAIEAAVRAKRFAELSETLTRIPSADDDARAHERHVVAALIAERAGHDELAKEAWRSANASASFPNDTLPRLAAETDAEADLGSLLLGVADAMPDGVASSILRLESVARTEMADDDQAAILERVHRANPSLGIGAFLAEHVARRKGDVDEVVRWIQERRSYLNDSLEAALDAVREALLIADHDADLAGARLEEAHRARPDDVALRELYERIAPEAEDGSAVTWEKRAEAATPANAARLWLEAAVEHDRAGDAAQTLRTVRKAAAAGDRGLSRPMQLRAEMEAGEVADLATHLDEVARTATNERTSLEALERLAEIEAFGRKDADAALRVHRAILDIAPRHKPSLRWLEHALITEGRDDELAPVFESIAIALDGTGGGESTGHAQHASRLFSRATQNDGSSLDRCHDMARLAATQPEPSLWSLRALNSHARLRKDDEAFFDTSVALVERTQRPAERATLLLRASEAAMRLERISAARALLEQAVAEDPGDVVAWGMLAELRERSGEGAPAAEACEALARASCVSDHQLLAWYDAARLWSDLAKDNDRAVAALEAAAEIDVTYADIFPRLSALYAERKREAELARLLELRLNRVDDEDERVTLEVELARALADLGELAKAKTALTRALLKRPDHTTALSAMADVCMAANDWAGAENASVRLARLLSDPDEQRAIYEKLGEIYSVHAPNLSRAEVAFKEILKRSPGDLGVLAKLVDIYKRQSDLGRAVDTQQEIVSAATDPDVRLAALIELASIHETVGRDPRKAERALDAARKEFPTSVVALRAMAEFYARHRQMPAMQILLDRAAADARRAFAQGRFVPSLFEVLHVAFELRGKHDAARVVAATLAAVEGQPSTLSGVDAQAIDPELDDLLAPELMSPALRAVLARTGDALDAVASVDLRTLAAKPLPSGTSIGRTVGAIATVIGLGSLQIFVSPHLGRVALPLSTNPPQLLVGEGLAREKNEAARVFVVARALKMLVARGSAVLRARPEEVPNLIAALFVALNPSFLPQGLDKATVTELARRIALPKNLDPTVGVLALEAAGTIGASWPRLGLAAQGWANRAGLLAVGDPNAALQAIAWAHDQDAPPDGAEDRAAWIARHEEARELLTFSVTDAYSEARTRTSAAGR